MKYVVFRHATGGLRVVLTLGEFSHRQLADAFPGFAAVSAGRVRFDEKGNAEVFGHSQSLGKTPHADDPRMLSSLYRVETAAAPSRSAKPSATSTQPANENQAP